MKDRDGFAENFLWCPECWRFEPREVKRAVLSALERREMRKQKAQILAGKPWAVRR